MKTLNNILVNEAQYKAITYGAGPMLVLAGPGSGKTFTITQRIQYLIEHHHVKPENILVITFTKAAAKEMQERFWRLNDHKIYPVNFGTFHAIFFQILRYTYRFTAENIIRERDKYRILSELITGETDKSTDTLERLLSEISRVKNSGMLPQDFQSEIVSQTEFAYLYDAYKKEMNRRRLLDFDDMVLLCRDLLASRPDTLKIWQQRFQYPAI